MDGCVRSPEAYISERCILRAGVEQVSAEAHTVGKPLVDVTFWTAGTSFPLKSGGGNVHPV
jgi:hypothetical protein